MMMRKFILFVLLFAVLITSGGAYAQKGGKSDKSDKGDKPVKYKRDVIAADVELVLIWVEGGTFVMGCNTDEDNNCEKDEFPTHKVKLDGFYIGKYEITQIQWYVVMNDNPSRVIGDDMPVTNVNWHDAQQFVQRLNARTGQKYRLPTEAEWEYAARGGYKHSKYKYSGSNNVNTVAWNAENGGDSIHPVGKKMQNNLNIYDMSGNVYEWCSDWYGAYGNDADRSPTGPLTGTARVVRGGFWHDAPRRCRVSDRDQLSPDLKLPAVGLRLVLQIQ
jgi:formylglycine-generating enzyme required for sulfatase activity